MELRYFQLSCNMISWSKRLSSRQDPIKDFKRKPTTTQIDALKINSFDFWGSPGVGIAPTPVSFRAPVSSTLRGPVFSELMILDPGQMFRSDEKPTMLSFNRSAVASCLIFCHHGWEENASTF